MLGPESNRVGDEADGFASNTSTPRPCRTIELTWPIQATAPLLLTRIDPTELNDSAKDKSVAE